MVLILAFQQRRNDTIATGNCCSSDQSVSLGSRYPDKKSMECFVISVPGSCRCILCKLEILGSIGKADICNFSFGWHHWEWYGFSPAEPGQRTRPSSRQMSRWYRRPDSLLFGRPSSFRSHLTNTDHQTTNADSKATHFEQYLQWGHK